MLANTNKGRMERHLNTCVIEGRACAAANVVRDEEPPIAYLRLAVHNDYVSKKDGKSIERVSYISVIARGKLSLVAANVRKDQLVSVKGMLLQQEDEFEDKKTGRLIQRDRVAVDAELIRMYELPERGQWGEGQTGDDEVNGNVRT